MNPQLINLAFAQLHTLCLSVDNRFNKSADVRKERLKRFLVNLSAKYVSTDVRTIPPELLDQMVCFSSIIREIALHLDGKNGYLLSHEMRFVLTRLCQEWTNNPQKYIFAVSDGAFSISNFSEFWPLFNIHAKQLIRQEFPYEFIMLRVPKNLCGDFLYTCSIYHEFGHFFDSLVNISDKISQQIWQKILRNENQAEIGQYFTGHKYCLDSLGNIDVKQYASSIKSYCGEYCADLFGAQYFGEHVLNYLELTLYGHENKDSFTHPSCSCRKRLVQSFVNGADNDVLLNIIKEEYVRLGYELKQRFEYINQNGLFGRRKLTIHNDDELHSVLYSVWEIYLNKMEVLTKYRSDLAQVERYQLVNKAAEKAIKQYKKKIEYAKLMHSEPLRHLFLRCCGVEARSYGL